MHALASFAFEMAACVLAPPRCAACDAPVRPLFAFCGPCAAAVHPAGRGLCDGVAAFVYGGPVARALVRFKYERRPDLARPLGDLLWHALRATRLDLSGPRVVVPVPLHAKRLAERGFNQAALLANQIACRMGAPVAPRALVRVYDTARQASLDRHSRTHNVAGAFRVRAPGQIRGASVLLVDDVRTTGSTLEECARAVRAAGAKRVAWAVVAHALDDRLEPGGNGPVGHAPTEGAERKPNASKRVFVSRGV
jgi:ComF family protein